MSRPTNDEIRDFVRTEVQDQLCLQDTPADDVTLRDLGADSLDAAELSLYFEVHFKLGLPSGVYVFSTDRITINQIVDEIGRLMDSTPNS